MSDRTSLTEPLTEEEEAEMEDWISGMSRKEQPTEAWQTHVIEMPDRGEIRITALLPEDKMDDIGKEMARLMQSA